MIVVLAGDAALGAELGTAISQRLPQAAVVRPDYFVPSVASNGDETERQEAPASVPWLADAMAASAQRIASHGGSSVIILPQLEDVPPLLVAFEHFAAPLFLFLLHSPPRHRGIYRLAVVVATEGKTLEALVESILADANAGRGLVRPAPAGTDETSLLPLGGGPSTGIDIIEIPRIERVVRRYGERFLQRVYTEAEQALYRGRVPELAARFAAKEAVSKALGTGIWGIRWREMEILPDMRGKPLVYLHGAAAARARELNLRHFAVSLSHSRELAMAVVVAT